MGTLWWTWSWTSPVLDHHHCDPFDRLLIAQARAEDLIIVSGGLAIARYPVLVV